MRSNSLQSYIYLCIRLRLKPLSSGLGPLSPQSSLLRAQAQQHRRTAPNLRTPNLGS